MRILICLVLSLTIAGCAKDHKCDCVMPDEIYYLKARVVQVSNLDCHLPALEFSEDSLRIRMTMNRNDLVYIAANLPAALAVANKKLYVSVALLKPEEDFFCTMMGVTFPHLKILDAKSRD